MLRSDLLIKIQAVLREVSEQDGLVVTPETRLEDIENLDSFGLITLFMSIEGTLGVRFAIDEISTMTTVGRVLDAIGERLAGQKTS